MIDEIDDFIDYVEYLEREYANDFEISKKDILDCLVYMKKILKRLTK